MTVTMIVTAIEAMAAMGDTTAAMVAAMGVETADTAAMVADTEEVMAAAAEVPRAAAERVVRRTGKLALGASSTWSRTARMCGRAATRH